MATHPEDPRDSNLPEPVPGEPPAESAGKPKEPQGLEPVVQGPGGTIDDSDSAIELGLPVSSDVLSDSDLHPPAADSEITSGIAWAALMEEIPEPPVDELRIDSPSDADLLAQPPSSGSDVTVPPELSAFPPAQSGVRPAEPPSSGDATGIDPFEPRDIFTAEPTGRYPRPDTHVGASASKSGTAGQPGDSTRVDLGAEPPRGHDSGVESSIIDLGAIDFPSGTATPSGAVEDAELAAESSGIDLAAEPVSGSGSGRDLIAEALESGIKFGPAPEPSDSGASDVSAEAPFEFASQQPPAPEVPPQPAPSAFSSAIDFGGPSAPPAGSAFSSAIDFGGPSAKPTASETPPPLPPPTGSAISSAIDYGGSSTAPPDSSSAVELAPDMPGGQPFERSPPAKSASGRPPTMNPASGRPATMNPAEDRPPTMNPAEGGRPPTMNPAEDRPATMNPDRPPTKNPAGGRPKTMYATDARPITEMVELEDMEAAMRQGGAVRTPADSEIDLGSHPSSGDFGPYEGPPGVAGKASPRPAKSDSDSDIDINIGELPDSLEAAGSGLFVNANSGRLEPTDATIDLDAGAVPEDQDETAPEVPALAPAKAAKKDKAPARKFAALPFPALPKSVPTPWLAAGAGLGAVVGGAAILLLQLLGGGSGTPPKPSPQPIVTQGPAPVAPAPQATAPAVSKFDLLQSGDLDKAAQAGIEQIDESNPEQLGHRGEFRWLAHLQKQWHGGAALNPEDPAVKAAAADLQAAADKGNADATFWLGHLQESTNAPDKAKATYTRGASQANDPLQKRRFEAALQRLELHEGVKPAGAARGPDAAEALLLALVALQGGAPAADQDEAGFAFWEAARLARDQNYAQAVQALDEARALHDQRRYTRLRKPQNPLSDPTEEVFLKCADELKAYWQLEDKLRSGGYLDVAAHRDPVKAVDGLIALAKDASAAKATLDKLATEQEQARIEITKLEAGMKAAKEAADAQAQKAKAAEQQLATEATKLKAAEDRASADAAKVKAAEAHARDVAEGKASAEADLKRLADELVRAKLLDPKEEKGSLLRSLQSAIRLASANDSQGMIRTLQGEINRVRDQLAQRWQPKEMLTFWLPLLADRTRTDLAVKAAADAARVADDAEATPVEQARARAILGLALRNQGKLAEAKLALEKARMSLAPGDAEWRDQVASALKDVADPSAYFLERADALQNRGKLAEAAAELQKAEKAYPAGKVHFQAERGLLELEAARAKTPDGVAPTGPAMQEARKDVEEAAKSGDAFALYAAGRVAEVAGDLEAAAANYRKALAAHADHDVAGSRYRLALARVLIHASATSEAPKPATKPGATSRRPASPAAAAFLVLTVLLQGPTAAANQSEALQLADEILAAPDSTLEMRAQALAIKGLYTQALMTYADALRPALSREQVQTLKDLIQTHPALRRPETQAVASPQDAERHYATGLRLLYSGQYPAAEQELLAAVARDGQDARYYYFLGLARLYQGKRDALEDFEQGARLEQQGLPPGEAVSSALERVQGAARRTIDSARGTPR